MSAPPVVGEAVEWVEGGDGEGGPLSAARFANLLLGPLPDTLDIGRPWALYSQRGCFLRHRHRHCANASAEWQWRKMILSSQKRLFVLQPLHGTQVGLIVLGWARQPRKRSNLGVGVLSDLSNNGSVSSEDTTKNVRCWLIK
jgi:hypothetical protein